MHAFRAAWLYMEDDLSHCLRLLLEAKDCAVRSRVPPPSGAACATGASEQQTQEPARPTRTVVVYGEKGSKFPHVVTLKENMADPAQREMLVFDMEAPVLLEEFEADCWGHAQTYVRAKYHQTLYQSPGPVVWEPWDAMLSVPQKSAEAVFCDRCRGFGEILSGGPASMGGSMFKSCPSCAGKGIRQESA